MMYTNEFFAVGNTAPNDDLVQLIDSFTGEAVFFKKVTTWVDGEILTANDPRVLQDEIIYRSRGNEYYVNTVMFSSRKVYVTSFGVKSDMLVDQRAFIQKAFDICSQLRLKLVFPNGIFLINSHTDNDDLRIAHGNVLELKSNLDIEFEEYSVIKMGEHFDNENFVLFSGFNHKCPDQLRPLFNITFKGKGTIDFNGDVSQVRGENIDRQIRRLGFEGANCTNVLIDGLHWINGDLSNCIGTGWAANGNIFIIQNCIFEDLTKSHEKSNYDHSTIYGNANFLTVHNNIFIGNEQMRLVGCACEIHSSNASFSNNKIYKYLRMNFVVSNPGEKGDVSDISITDNIAEITSSAVFIWPVTNSTVSNLLISSNNIKHTHVQGKNDMAYNGGQALFVVQGKGGNCKRITVRGNTSHILYTEGDYSRVAAGIFADTESLEITDNNFIGHSYGILFDWDQDEAIKKHNNYSFVKISGNNITAASQLVKMVAEKVNYCLIANNSTVLEHNAMTDLIKIESPSIQSTTVRDNIYISNQPKVEFTPSSVFLADPSNKAKYALSLVSTPVPSINAGASVLISPVLSGSHKRVGGMYTIQPTYPFPELFFNAHTFGAGGTEDIKFKVDNMTSSVFSGNPDLVSNLIINL